MTSIAKVRIVIVIGVRNCEIGVIPYYYTLDFKRVFAVGIVILVNKVVTVQS